MRRVLIASVATLLAVVGGCRAEADSDRDADLTGTITRVERAAEGGGSAVALVEAQPGGASGPSAYVAITARTALLRAERTTPEESARAFGMLTPGRVVRVWFAGPVRESHPMQGTAERIVILDSTASVQRAPSDATITRRIVISIEGMEESLTVRRYQSPPGIPIEFTTWLPEDMLADPVSSGEGDAVRFVANFGGVRNDDAVLSFHVHRADATEVESRSLARGAAGHVQTIPISRGDLPAWAAAGWRVSGGPPLTMGGTILLGNRGGRWFSLINIRPDAYAHVWGPRGQLILDGWRWEDGAPLE